MYTEPINGRMVGGAVIDDSSAGELEELCVPE